MNLLPLLIFHVGLFAVIGLILCTTFLLKSAIQSLLSRTRTERTAKSAGRVRVSVSPVRPLLARVTRSLPRTMFKLERKTF